MWGFRRKSYRAQPPGFPDAVSLHSLWGRIGWKRNCINLVPVKMLKTKGFVSLMISYNYSSLALDNSQSILMLEDHVGKGVSRRFCVHLIDHTLCGAPAFVQISTVGEGMATVFVNLRKYWFMLCTKAATFTSRWWCGPQLDGPWSGGQSWLFSMANSKIPVLLFRGGSLGLGWEAAEVILWFIQILSGYSRPRQKISLLFSMWQKSLEVLSSFTKRNLEVSFHCLAPSPISPASRTIWAGQ